MNRSEKCFRKKDDAQLLMTENDKLDEAIIC